MTSRSQKESLRSGRGGGGIAQEYKIVNFQVQREVVQLFLIKNETILSVFLSLKVRK